MNNKERKEFIFQAIEKRNFDNIDDARRELGGFIDSLEAVPFGSRNEIIRICEDLANGIIDSKESIARLKAFVGSVPD